MMQDSQLARFGLFDARVPRYTSYPTAPHFSSDVGADRTAAWMAAVPEASQISLYVHVPFCRRLCWFCACRTQGTKTADPLRGYLDTLKAELDLLAENLPAGITLSRLHWGGGTPTLMPAPMIRELAGAIAAVLPMAPKGEFSVEIDPNEIDDARLDALAEAGMRRASIGVQDFDPEIQRVIGREQTFEVTQEAVNKLRQRGNASLNADILFGLPHQTPARLSESVQKLLSLSPDRVALYGYAHVPNMARRQMMIPSDTLPRPEERLQLFDTARQLFVWDGYREIGIDHFARPGDGLEIAARTGKLRRNFQGYTDDTAPVLIGAGASSISRFPQGYAQNAAATSEYQKRVRAGSLATARGHVFRGDDTLRARMIEAVMCDFGIHAKEMTATWGADPAWLKDRFDEVAQAFAGMVEVTDDGLWVPERARPLTRLIARALDAYDLSLAGHSSAI
jgi:oxygen-independent coproporphyrinogen-3 oxidase